MRLLAIETAEEVVAAEPTAEIVFGRADLWPVLFVPLLAVGAVVFGVRARRRALARLGQPRLIARLVASVHAGKRLLQTVLALAALVASSLGLLRLQYGGSAELVPASGVDLVLAVDYSKSMLAKDVYPSRSERLEAELGRFLDAFGRRGHRVGLVVFAGEARGLPVTSDMRILKLYLEHADPQTETPGGTAIGRALALGLTFLVDARGRDRTAGSSEQAADAEQVIILLTDGEDTASRPREVAKEAQKLGIRVFTVGIGSPSGEPIVKFNEAGEPDGFVTDKDGQYVMTRLDEPLLKELAESTGGRYVRVDPQAFSLEALGGALESLSSVRREDTLVVHREEGYVFFIGPALLCLCLALVLGDRRRGA